MPTLRALAYASGWYAMGLQTALNVPDEKVSTPNQATNAVQRHTFEEGGYEKGVGFRSEEHVDVITNFFVDAAIDGFAKPGDRVWQVHFHSEAKARQAFFWVNARSGAVCRLLPVKTR